MEQEYGLYTGSVRKAQERSSPGVPADILAVWPIPHGDTGDWLQEWQAFARLVLPVARVAEWQTLRT